jgi:hypothetical protein
MFWLAESPNKLLDLGLLFWDCGMCDSKEAYCRLVLQRNIVGVCLIRWNCCLSITANVYMYRRPPAMAPESGVYESINHFFNLEFKTRGSTILSCKRGYLSERV